MRSISRTARGRRILKGKRGVESDDRQYHEPLDRVARRILEFRRAIRSLIEELEAVDWYSQRADATENPKLKAVVVHNRDEEIEHACMLLEWLRRNSEVWDGELRTYLFTDDDLVAMEGE